MYDIVVPLEKTMLLNANQRIHWAVRVKRTRYWRELSTVACKSAMNRGMPALRRAQVDAWFTFPDGRRRDIGNLYPTIKACVDGFVDAKLLPDDSDEYLTGPFLRRTPGKGQPTIRFTITPLGSE